ncbi:MAG: DUF2312 domain-containing protein [Patescibacteria group bacterium]|nr:DUF2312 domain-containing protein [Patescibacteria group bacterium]
MEETMAKAPTKQNSELSSYIDRIERLDEEKKAISGDIKDIYAEAKSKGYDVAAMKRVIRDRRRKEKNTEKFKAENDSYNVYASAMDLFA